MAQYTDGCKYPILLPVKDTVTHTPYPNNYDMYPGLGKLSYVRDIEPIYCRVGGLIHTIDIRVKFYLDIQGNIVEIDNKLTSEFNIKRTWKEKHPNSNQCTNVEIINNTPYFKEVWREGRGSDEHPNGFTLYDIK